MILNSGINPLWNPGLAVDHSMTVRILLVFSAEI